MGTNKNDLVYFQVQVFFYVRILWMTFMKDMARKTNSLFMYFKLQKIVIMYSIL